MRAIFQWHVGGRVLELGRRTLIMGVVNVTPDSFSDGGKYIDAAKAVEHGERLFDEGATIIDVGGESTRPGAEVVSEDEEGGRRRRWWRVSSDIIWCSIRDLVLGSAWKKIIRCSRISAICSRWGFRCWRESRENPLLGECSPEVARVTVRMTAKTQRLRTGSTGRWRQRLL